MRKSRREKEKEAADAKKREEEENAARAYAEFLDAFEGEAVAKKQAGPGFVRSSKDSGIAYTPSVQSKAEGSSRSMRPLEEMSEVRWTASRVDTVLTTL